MSRMADHAAEVACGAAEPVDPGYREWWDGELCPCPHCVQRRERMDVEDAPGGDEPGLSQTLTTQALALRDSWIDGNRSHVLDELAAETPAEGLVLAAMLAHLLKGPDRAGFLGALIGRAEVAFRQEDGS